MSKTDEPPHIFEDYDFYDPDAPDDRDAALASCPVCNHNRWLNTAQYEGRESIDCPACPYHQTFDFREIIQQ